MDNLDDFFDSLTDGPQHASFDSPKFEAETDHDDEKTPERDDSTDNLPLPTAPAPTLVAPKVDRTKLVGTLALTDDDPEDDPTGNALDLLDYVEQHFWSHGSIPTVEYAREIGLDSELFDRWMRSTVFRDHLISRGVRLPEVGTSLGVGALTPRQFNAIKIMTDLLDNRSQKRKLSELQISTAEWNTWQMDPVFADYYRKYSENMLKAAQPEAHMALIDNVRGGDMQAIKYFNEMTGRFVSQASKGSTFDPGKFIQQVVEILQQEVKDTEVLKNIGKRMMGVIMAAEAEKVG